MRCAFVFVCFHGVSVCKHRTMAASFTHRSLFLSVIITVIMIIIRYIPNMLNPSHDSCVRLKALYMKHYKMYTT